MANKIMDFFGMDLSWLAEPTVWVGFFTLIILEVVLGIDNLVFIAILANKVHPNKREKARIIGLSLAIVVRIMMLAIASKIVLLKDPLFYISNIPISGRGILMFIGGFFLIYKATTELHERLEGQAEYTQENKKNSRYTPILTVVLQILLIDAVFSLDSVMTAVAMVNHISVAMAAVVVAMGVMIWASKSLTKFVNEHPTVVILCLGFLLMIGFSLIMEGFNFEAPKGYLYAAIGFSILIEIFNQIAMRNRKVNTYSSTSWRKRTADGVLGMMGIRESVLAKANKQGEKITDDSIFEDNEKHMIKSVLTLAEKSVTSIMTPRRDIERLNISKTIEQQKKRIQETPFSRLIVIGKAGIEEPLGYINKKDILTQLLSKNTVDINSVIRQPLVLLETITVLNSIELFRNQSADLALIVDEFGAILGMVTMKDLIEAIAGEFPEEYEREDGPSIQENPDNSFTVEASLEYEELAAQISLPALDEDSDFHTVAGLIMEELQSIPNVGDFVNYEGWRFEVLEKDGQRIEKILIQPCGKEE